MSNGNIAVGGSREIEMEKKIALKDFRMGSHAYTDRGYKTAETHITREDKNQINKVLQ